MSSWITDRKPSLEDLSATYQPSSDYKVYSGWFIVWDGKTVGISKFVKPPKPFNGYYPGYWVDQGKEVPVLAWMPLPNPPKSQNLPEL